MAAFLVRSAREADRQALLANTVALNRFENEITGDRVTEASSAEAVLDYFKRRTANGGLMLVAEAEGRIIGHLFLAVEEAAPFLAPEYRREGSICDAFVEEASRGQGAFRAMLEVATAHARAAGCRRLHIGVRTGNDRAERIYHKAGFRNYAQELVQELDLP
ncbi:MAG: GNAT family N-acetyltransferase [Alphaproteobacteria bacterium]|nr:GNAT family N-acetyltransferase [Alphaproteobacteria bacterium]